MKVEKLRKELSSLPMTGCDGCERGCKPPTDKLLCPHDVEQILSLIDENIRLERERIVLWGMESCWEHNRGNGGLFTRRECPICWGELADTTKKEKQ
jgi:hypothetical protein